MNFIKKHKSLIILLTIIFMLITIISYRLVIIAVAEETNAGSNPWVFNPGSDTEGYYTMLDANGVTVNIPFKITEEYAQVFPSYTEITIFPVDAAVFNQNQDYFCVQHRTAYASATKTVEISDTYHKHYPVSRHNLKDKNKAGVIANPFGNDNIYTNDMKGDAYADGELSTADTLLQIVLDKKSEIIDNDLNLATSIGLLKGFRDLKESAAYDLAYSNFCYQPVNTTFDCEGDESEIKKSGEHFSDGAMAFLIATSKSERTNYQNDKLQRAIWHWRDELGGGESNPLYALAKKFDQYHEESKTPDVDILPSDNAGTTIEGTTLTVGPFTMSDYISASDYIISGKFTYETDENEETTEEGEETTEEETEENKEPATSDDDSSVATLDKLVEETVNQTLQDKFGSRHYGGITKMYAILSDGTNKSDKIEIFSGETVPDPNEEFNVTLPDSYLANYDELYQIVCEYQRIHACANGKIYDGTQHKIEFFEQSGSINEEYNYKYSTHFAQGSVRYQCTVCEAGRGTVGVADSSGLRFEERSDAPATHYRVCSPSSSTWCEHGYSSAQHPSNPPSSTHRFCAYAAYSGHPHTKDCYSTTPNCGKSKHKHTVDGGCYEDLTCTALHIHGTHCADASICSVPEHAEHDSSCYGLSCKIEEHSHDDWDSNSDNGCYGKLVCDYKEYSKTSYCHPHDTTTCYNCKGSTYCEHGHQYRLSWLSMQWVWR